MTDRETINMAVGILDCMELDVKGRAESVSVKNPIYDVCKQRLAAIDMAKTAIREKLEREKGCEFCLTVSNADCELMKNFSTKDDFSGKEIVDDGNHPAQYIRRYKKRYFIVTEFADDEGTCIVCEIKNCPMCGRNLHLLRRNIQVHFNVRPGAGG